jgi:hypothetical protein
MVDLFLFLKGMTGALVTFSYLVNKTSQEKLGRDRRSSLFSLFIRVTKKTGFIACTTPEGLPAITVLGRGHG